MWLYFGSTTSMYFYVFYILYIYGSNNFMVSLGIPNKDILGFPIKERKKMQDEARAEIDKNWKDELDAKNKAKANINEETIRIDWVKQKSKAGQIKYYGSKSRWALVESGVITKDSQMFKTITTPKGKVTVKKTLKELNNSGIITVSASRVRHSTLGDYKAASKQYPTGRMTAGGHTASAMAECDRLGIPYEVNGEFSNGVRIGNVPSSATKIKRNANAQAWFPDNWTEDEIYLAGTYVANSNDVPLVDGYHKTAVYNGVAVRVLFDPKDITKVSTICPDLDQNIYISEVVMKWKNQ
ncbi:MAG: EndoU domain-containing protein [Ruminococcus sp.]